jgi:hypothetical protein
MSNTHRKKIRGRIESICKSIVICAGTFICAYSLYRPESMIIIAVTLFLSVLGVIALCVELNGSVKERLISCWWRYLYKQ